MYLCDSWVSRTIVGYCQFRGYHTQKNHSGSESKGYLEEAQNNFIAYKTGMQSRWPPRSHLGWKYSALRNCKRLREGFILFFHVFILNSSGPGREYGNI